MECGKIVITRLRNTEYYKGEPLNHIVDSIYQLLENFIVEYDTEWPVSIETHNCSLPSRKKNRNTLVSVGFGWGNSSEPRTTAPS